MPKKGLANAAFGPKDEPAGLVDAALDIAGDDAAAAAVAEAPGVKLGAAGLNGLNVLAFALILNVVLEDVGSPVVPVVAGWAGAAVEATGLALKGGILGMVMLAKRALDSASLPEEDADLAVGTAPAVPAPPDGLGTADEVPGAGFVMAAVCV